MRLPDGDAARGCGEFARTRSARIWGRMTPIDVMHYTLALAFLAICLLAAVIVVRQRC